VESVGANENDQISSYRIVREEEADAPQACFFEHADYQGRKFCLESGESWDAKSDLSLNDVISSMTIEDGLRVTVFERSDRGGRQLRVRHDISTVSPEWNETISSIKVR
jgi:phosphopantetheine adenylyltransferase